MRLSPRSSAFTLLLGALSALPPLSVDVSLPTLPTVGAALDASPGELQATLSAFLLGFAAGQLVFGSAADRFGRRPVLLAGLSLYVLAGAACALSGSIVLLVAMRLLQGLGACAGLVVARAVVRDSFEGSVAAAKQSVLSSVSMLAMLTAPILGGAVLAAFGWRAVYAVLPIAGALLLAGVAARLPETRRAAPRGLGYARVFSESASLGHIAVNALIFGGMFAYISASPHVLLGRFGVGPQDFGFFFAITAVGSLAGASLNRVLVRRIPAARLSAFGLLLVGAAVLVLAVSSTVSPSLGLIVGAMTAYTFACGIVMPNAITAAMAPLPDVAGAAAAVVGFTQFAVGAASAALVGMYRPGTVGGMVTIIAAFAIPGVIAGAWLRRATARSASW